MENKMHPQTVELTKVTGSIHRSQQTKSENSSYKLLAKQEMRLYTRETDGGTLKPTSVKPSLYHN